MKKILISFFVLLFSFISNAYPPLSPYSYCGGDPVNCLDPTGEDSVVLNFGHDIMHQHLAMLIQNKDGKWQYYSVNGDNVYISGEHKGGRPFNDIAVGSWDSPQEFFNSPYNVRTDNSKNDKSVNHFGFQEGYRISTSPEQDASMRKDFKEESKKKYTPLGNNCATVVQKVMFNAGIQVASPVYEKISIPENIFLGEPTYEIVRPNFNNIPSIAFESIMNLNPGGIYYYR